MKHHKQNVWNSSYRPHSSSMSHHSGGSNRTQSANRHQQQVVPIPETPLTSVLDSGTYTIFSYNPRCIIIQKVRDFYGNFMDFSSDNKIINIFLHVFPYVSNIHLTKKVFFSENKKKLLNVCILSRKGR